MGNFEKKANIKKAKGTYKLDKKVARAEMKHDVKVRKMEYRIWLANRKAQRLSEIFAARGEVEVAEELKKAAAMATAVVEAEMRSNLAEKLNLVKESAAEKRVQLQDKVNEILAKGVEPVVIQAVPAN